MMKKTILVVIVVLMLAIAGTVQAQSSGSEQGWAPGYGPGFRTGPGMMSGSGMERGPGHGGMGPDLWGYHYTKRMTANCEKFLDDTVQFRKEYFSKRFDYYEALRNPKTTAEVLGKLEAEMADLNQKVWAKNPHGCWWY